MNTVIIIPALNPDERLVRLVDTLTAINLDKIIVVDDGSDDAYKGIFKSLESYNCTVLHHMTNLGKGQAIKTAIDEIAKNYPDVNGFVTADSDGQHTAEDIKNICCEMQKNGNSLILGVRDFNDSNVPFKSRYGNRFSSAYFKLVTGTECPDTQTGLRGIPILLFDIATETEGSRYEYEMNFLMNVARKKIPIIFMPIQTIYTDNNKQSHFRPIADSARIYGTPLKFAASSLICAAADLSLFTLLTLVINNNVATVVTASTVIARMFSGVLNFFLNRKWSFLSSKNKISSQAVKYTALFIIQMTISSLSVTALSSIGLPLTVIKIFVDSILFIFSYFIQKKWIFNKNLEGIDAK